MPTGSIILWGGTTDVDPPGFYICDGRLLSISLFPALYAVIGNSYYNNYPEPIAPGTFFLPDLTFAIPQGAPKTNYFASFTVQGNYIPGSAGLVNTMYNVPGVSPSDSARRIWLIVTNKAGTINVGSLIPNGQYAGQTSALYIQSIVQTDPSTGNPSIIAVESVNGSQVAFLGQGNIVNINCSGIFRQAPPLGSFWVPGAFNELAFTNTGSNGPGITGPYKRNTRTQTGVEVGEHTHTYLKTAFFGSTGLANGTEQPGKGSDPNAQTAGPTQNMYDSLNNIWAAPYPTKPNVINMFYIIKT
jgi:microcystin-dependent protein